MVIHKVGEVSYSINKYLDLYWKKNGLELMKKQNSDRVYIVDGRERSGKSTWIFQQMGILEPELFENPEKFCSRVCIDAYEFNEVARKTKNGVVIFDEGFRGFSSRAALSKTNRLLIQTLMEMGQNNNIIFIAVPSIFLLDIYPGLIRSDGLFHIKIEKKSKLRSWNGYNRSDKNQIYKEGARKGWNYKFTPFRANFFNKFPGGEEFEKAYLEKKQKAFAEISKEMKKPEIKKDVESKYSFYFTNALSILKEKTGLSNKEITEALQKYGIDLKERAIATRIAGNYVKSVENSKNLAK